MKTLKKIKFTDAELVNPRFKDLSASKLSGFPIWIEDGKWHIRNADGEILQAKFDPSFPISGREFFLQELVAPTVFPVEAGENLKLFQESVLCPEWAAFLKLYGQFSFSFPEDAHVELEIKTAKDTVKQKFFNGFGQINFAGEPLYAFPGELKITLTTDFTGSIKFYATPYVKLFAIGK